MNVLIEKLPLASLGFLGYAIVGACMVVAGTLDYGTLGSNLLAIGIACGALGLPRAISKVANGHQSLNVLGFIETLQTPSIVFGLYVVAGLVLLILGHITVGVFSDNVEKVGIACGVLQAAKSAEHVFLPSP